MHLVEQLSEMMEKYKRYTWNDLHIDNTYQLPEGD